MQLIKLNVTNGPNYWSNYRKKLIILKLDLQKYKNIYTNQILNFNDSLKKLMPSLHEHRCSMEKAGGFFQRLTEGTLLGHVVEHIALELQTLAGMPCGYGRTRETCEEGVFFIIFSYEIELAGIYAAKSAIQLVETLVNGKGNPYQDLSKNIEELKNLHAQFRLGPSTEAIIKESLLRNIPVHQIDTSLVMLGYGANQKIISSTLSPNTSCIGDDIVADKNFTKELLKKEFVPMPLGKIINSIEELSKEIDQLGYPLVIKPRYGNHGKGVTTNITSKEKALIAFSRAKAVSNSIMVEKFIKGKDYRFLVINYKVAAVAKRTPPSIIGDGARTVKQLINEINNDPKRGKGHENFLTQITIDTSTHSILHQHRLTEDSILPLRQKIVLKDTANISTGGTATDVTDKVHPHNIFLAERIARLVNLDVCGIDVISSDITQPITSGNGAVLEINAAPGFRMHLSPTTGKKRNVAKPFIDMLYMDHDSSRIPIVAVTGTNGKTTVVRLIAHLAAQAKYSVGMATTEGIYINNNEIFHGDCSGPQSATLILRDPLVNFAVLECARGGILRSGLAFDKCNVSIVTNVSEDHLGSSDIFTLEEMARVKSVVPRSTTPDGYAILNAQDNLVYAMKNDLDCNIALFGLTKCDRIIEHIKHGGLCCYIEKGTIFICHNKKIKAIANIIDVPLSLNGNSSCMKQNILPALLAGWICRFDFKDLLDGLLKFLPNDVYLPGRMNLFKFQNCDLILDYAHNENAYIELKKYVNGIKANKKIGIIAGTGDRRNTDIWKTGFYSAQIFDEIIIRSDKDGRGRSQEEITNIIISGIHAVDKEKKIKIIPDEFAAVQHAIHESYPGTFIWYFPDNVLKAVNFLNHISMNFSKSRSHAT